VNRGLPDANIIIGLIVKLIFIGFYIVTFSHEEKRGVKMEKKLIVIKQDKRGNGEFFADIFKDNGWKLETIDLSAGELLPKSLENNDGLHILSKTANVFEQSSWPLTVYMAS
jgi:nitrogen fixation protein